MLRSSEPKLPARPLIAGLMMLTAVACSTAQSAPPSVDVSGKWAATWAYQPSTLGAGTVSGTFLQDSGKLSDNFLIVGGGNAVRNPAATIVGFISGNQVTCRNRPPAP